MISFFCKECGNETPKWTGKCPHCGAWNSLVETESVKKRTKNSSITLTDNMSSSIPLDKVTIKSNYQRLKTGLSEFDCVLGGGIVPGMVALIGGEPGIGKSTIMMQLSGLLSNNSKILYVSGEESLEQIKIRCDRLSINHNNILLFCSNDTDSISREINLHKPDLVIIDSIQAIFSPSVDNLPGSVTQIKETASLLTRIAKKENIPLFFIGHVTKEGFVAGPKILEHMVDTVLYFEGELSNQFKILRTTKNRFGSTNEIGLFEMTEKGLQQLDNPSQIFLMHQNHYPGTAVSSVIEGSRAFLMEVQALVSPTNYGNAQRVSVGYDQKKLALLLAVIEKNLMINMKEFDVFINFSGGIKVLEPSADLAVVAALLSSFRDKTLPEKSIFIGEVGLNGDIRTVAQMDKRIKEAVKLGYNNIITAFDKKNDNSKTKCHQLKHINQLASVIF
jgi:DNA repair protein RadA/Sms